MLDIFAKLLKALNSETDPGQISLAFVFGMIMGFTPLLSFHNIFVLFLVLVTRINISAFLASLAFFSGFAYLLDGPFVQLGSTLLSNPDYLELWTGFYNTDFWRLTHFNNTLTLGSLIISLALTIPLYVTGVFLIKNYRDHVMTWVRKTKLAQIVKASKFYKLFAAVNVGGLGQ
ncbi:MAG: TIGR03546 family protein [Pseudomonadales bacterium]|nr:TIGR03546 family protein [Pseudomonadales bacterium]